MDIIDYVVSICDVLVPPVADSMSRDRFQEVKYLHFGRLTIIRNKSIEEHAKYRLSAVENVPSCSSIDEAMVKYFGHNSAKHFTDLSPSTATGIFKGGLVVFEAFCLND